MAEGTVDRMSVRQRLEHGFLALCVLVLISTGLALAYHGSWWSGLVIRLSGGPGGRGIVHRAAALGLLGVGLSHLLGLLFSRRYQEDLRASLPRGQDLQDAWAGFLHSVTGKGSPPRCGRFTPMQKIQYWGILLACLFMGVSGALLWSPAATMALFPKAVLDLMLLVHSRQAQVIVLLFILWHLYDVHLAGGNFPMNPAWLTGKMPEAVYRRQHAGEAEARAEASEP